MFFLPPSKKTPPLTCYKCKGRKSKAEARKERYEIIFNGENAKKKQITNAAIYESC